MLHSKKIVRILVDFFAIVAAFLIAHLFSKDFIFLSKEFFIAFIILATLWFATLTASNKLYGRFEYTRFKGELASVFNNYYLHLLIFPICYLWLLDGSWLFVGIFYLLLLCTLLLGRLFLRIFLPRLQRVNRLNYVVIGYCDALERVEKTVRDIHLGKVLYLGSFGEDIPPQWKRIEAVDKIYDYLSKNNVNLILQASNEMEAEDTRKLMNYAKLNFIDYKIIPLEINLLTSGIKMELHDGFPLLSIKDEDIARIRNRLAKRVFDIFFSSFVAIFVLSWLIPILGILIKLESKGPIFFTQERVGYKNRKFIVYKFRSMVVNSSAGQQATKDDARITKIGAFIRKTNIDELPQFLNVLQGYMSVVGPRPHANKQDIEFKDEIEEYILRYYAKPGITGWAQVNGFRGPSETTEQKVGRAKCDIWYLRHWSFFLDMKIIWLTIFSSKSRENAF